MRHIFVNARSPSQSKVSSARDCDAIHDVTAAASYKHRKVTRPAQPECDEPLKYFASGVYHDYRHLLASVIIRDLPWHEV